MNHKHRAIKKLGRVALRLAATSMLICSVGSMLGCNCNPQEDQPCGFYLGETGGGGADVGSWSNVHDWSSLDPPVVAVHAMHLPTGKILFWGVDDHYLYDIEAETFEYIEANFNDINTCNGQICEDDSDCEGGQTCSPTTYKPDLFCAGHTVLPNGDAMIAGGNDNGSFAGGGLRDIVLLDANAQTWSYDTHRLLLEGRWYPTLTVMADGRVFIMGGTNAGEVEVYDPSDDSLDKYNSAYPLTDPNSPNEQGLAGILYPYVFVLPDERIFVGGCEDCGTSEQWDGIIFNHEQDMWLENTTFPAENRGGSAVMYRPGKIMKAGGGDQPSGITEVIDFSEFGRGLAAQRELDEASVVLLRSAAARGTAPIRRSAERRILQSTLSVPGSAADYRDCADGHHLRSEL